LQKFWLDFQILSTSMVYHNPQRFKPKAASCFIWRLGTLCDYIMQSYLGIDSLLYLYPSDPRKFEFVQKENLECLGNRKVSSRLEITLLQMPTTSTCWIPGLFQNEVHSITTGGLWEMHKEKPWKERYQWLEKVNLSKILEIHIWNLTQMQICDLWQSSCEIILSF
jgi:hypothetical protein